MKRLLENFKKYLTEGTTMHPSLQQGEEGEKKKTVTVGRVIYDPYEGLGNVPNGQEVDHRGFTVWMKPSEFIKLNPARRDESEFVKQHFENSLENSGKVSVAPCWVTAEYIDGVWKVDGHEGRGRAAEIHKLQPNELMPVSVFPRGKKAESLTPSMVRSSFESDAQAQELGEDAFSITPSTMVFNGELIERWRETSWTRPDGEKVDIGQVVDYLGDNVVELNVSELSSQLPSLPTQGEDSPERIATANLDYPIIIVKSKGQYKYILDGNHRLQRAIDTKEETIKAKVLDLDNLDDSETSEKFKRMFGGAA